MKFRKKLLVVAVLFISLSAVFLAQTNNVKAAIIGPVYPENLTASQRKDIITAYDLNKDGKITTRDVALMKKAGTYSSQECSNVQYYVVQLVKFEWCTIEATSMKQFNKFIGNDRVLYFEYFPYGTSKIIAHVKRGSRFVSIVYDYAKYRGR